MYLIVGLGNPGEEYAHTRHNAGFDTVDALADELGVRYWKNEGGALVGKASYRGHELLLVKPQSFMNTSGGPVSKLMRAYGVAPDHLIVVHDELDIDPGTVRVKFGGGHAGHNGLRSICERVLMDVMYDLPEHEGATAVTVRASDITGETKPEIEPAGGAEVLPMGDEVSLQSA